MKPPLISILVCTKNRRESLGLTLETIGKVNVPSGWNVELLVVDNDPENSSRTIVTDAPFHNIHVRYLEEARKGKSAACNTGIAAAHGDIFLFTDDDVRVPANWVEGMCRPIVEGNADAVQGVIKIPPHLDRPWLKGALRIWVAGNDSEQLPEGALVGSNMALSRKAIEMAGGFNNRLGPGISGYFEDTLLGWALTRAGGRIVYNSKMAVDHYFDAERLRIGSFISAAQGMAVSRSVAEEILDPNPPRPSVLSLLKEIPAFSVRCVTQAIAYFTDRRPDPGFIIRYYRLCLWVARRMSLENPSQLPWPLR